MIKRVTLFVVLLACLAVMAGGCARPATPDADRTRAAGVLPDRELADRENAEAVDLLRAGKFDEAERVLKSALDADVTHGPSHNNLGKIYFHQGKYYLAAWEFQYAARLMPHQPEPRNNLGMVFEQVGRLDDAVQWYGRASELESDNPQLFGNLARARVRRGDGGDELRTLLSKIVEIDTRQEWVAWAKERLALLRDPVTQPAEDRLDGG